MRYKMVFCVPAEGAGGPVSRMIAPTATMLPGNPQASSSWLRQLDRARRAFDALHVSIAIRAPDVLATPDAKTARAAAQPGCPVAAA